jgi:enolase
MRPALVTRVGSRPGSALMEPMELLLAAIERAGYTPGGHIAINLDAAASEFYERGSYVFRKSDGSKRKSEDMITYWAEWLDRYPAIYSLEDGLAEDDWQGWKDLTLELGHRIQLVGDDIFVTNPSIFERGIREGIANSILIKLNQIGTVTEALECIERARANGYGIPL